MIVPLRPTTAQHAIHRFLQHPLPELLHALPGEGFQRLEPKVTRPSPYLPSRFVRHFLNRFRRHPLTGAGTAAAFFVPQLPPLYDGVVS